LYGAYVNAETKRLLALSKVPKIGTVNAFLMNAQKPGSGQIHTLTASAVVTPAAGQLGRVVSFADILGDIQTLDPTEDNVALIIDSYIYEFFFESEYQFFAIPFILEQENGEAFNSTDIDNFYDPGTTVDTIITGNYRIKFGEVIESDPFRDNGTKYWRGNGILDITSEVSKYLRGYYQKMIKEEPLHPFKLGYMVFMDTANKAFSISTRKILDYHTKEMKIGVLD